MTERKHIIETKCPVTGGVYSLEGSLIRPVVSARQVSLDNVNLLVIRYLEFEKPSNFTLDKVVESLVWMTVTTSTLSDDRA
jgi:hypothetical protein